MIANDPHRSVRERMEKLKVPFSLDSSPPHKPCPIFSPPPFHLSLRGSLSLHFGASRLTLVDSLSTSTPSQAWQSLRSISNLSIFISDSIINTTQPNSKNNIVDHHHHKPPSPSRSSSSISTNTRHNSRPKSDWEITPCPLPETMHNTTHRRRLAPIVEGLIGGGLVIISKWWRKSKTTNEDVEVPAKIPVRFSYQDLRVATDTFKEIIGRGGFGSVFKGVLAYGTRIAVKRLDNLEQGKKAVLAEVETIGRLHHCNLLRLIGFCSEKSYKILVYEYMSNGSLDNWIFQNGHRPCLDWQTRKKITLDIAKGLAYLHEECQQTIIHFDIKPQNILLDPNFNAKICDFGLSKAMDTETGQVEISVRGTPGYIAPEWCKLAPGSRIT
ncbi:unnamed protein product [Dovyalis caffra]|uniref:non-specific serine/threonine protein kinase n=1 Tax=Dovyalis caffra TaxID=77055 RepID=A0AAV1SHQ8_9ROSI|nr:unnamed protein product [Dovyalis caffra]